ncbi:uncharacterized protein OCT59_027780 [Rhizophagus irregularis]|uniref:Proteophosphoglycan 5 n=2 Tax=Rhizophagus irregularis TaxID=588596 RepID=A0A015LUG8_RHIIW|nr:hypothetical protein GLOIN_2v1502928 [Rhizophagus irregularis DAOM 181602=DAOM 197198]EXX76331.1 hypothetical protein RirG_034130 [Rhizophagus irregularis DAOM 197198w]POG81836.1 hypothetical protein GLOIN_2v1502928 [Rhizophagus irregularis DAOM 181602=DAOM 197198]UZO07496.1 hypothetical protein OCT59_027780 [Rhizophagus irregularis]GBC15660.1 hypothetical protein GLOIN_2v1502928 [Rhizophagus irregularis DAOM 181602=DAOM 197198]|eukprot:XP_025188702.1 hypothetical protein GLOIN_2v1502928 [Rhizophagus irregularis DAOM 181602=DAOM 197198]
MFKQPIVNINISWNRETFKLLLIIFIFWSLISYLYFYKNNNVNNDNITNSSTQPDIGEIGEPISIIQSQSPSQSPSQSQSKDAIMTLSPSTPTNTSSPSTPTTSPSTNTTSTPTFHVDIIINQKYCQSNTCRFLFAYYPPEQETQANQHFLSFVQLAEKLNRIMVLTNVGNSHIFACQPFSFDFYYNVDKLQKRFPNVKFITQKDFQFWTKERKEKPDTFHGFITINKNHSYTVNHVQPYVEKLNLSNCLRLFNLRLNDTTIFKDIYLSKGKNLETFENLILKELDTNAEVLLIKHEIRYPLFKPLSSLDYANHIIDAANSISEKLRPYIASHWRMELGKPKMMPDCAKNLVKWVKDKESRTGIKNLYLATDYPLLGENKAQSTTFHVITKYHINAIQILNSSVSLNTWVSLHPFDYLPKDKWIKKELMGAGIQGILDKLVLIQADYFVSCPKVCGRYISKYTKKVREERTKNVGKKYYYLKNVWEMWYEN